ncbi:hypothetical protein C8R44DRAFT_741422 [Mycena epipterygia]|nr:hypothetical protein C8R44DRAFT_741422 [Mycena epipterygia]
MLAFLGYSYRTLLRAKCQDLSESKISKSTRFVREEQSVRNRRAPVNSARPLSHPLACYLRAKCQNLSESKIHALNRENLFAYEYCLIPYRAYVRVQLSAQRDSDFNRENLFAYELRASRRLRTTSTARRAPVNSALLAYLSAHPREKENLFVASESALRPVFPRIADADLRSLEKEYSSSTKERTRTGWRKEAREYSGIFCAACPRRNFCPLQYDRVMSVEYRVSHISVYRGCAPPESRKNIRAPRGKNARIFHRVGRMREFSAWRTHT